MMLKEKSSPWARLKYLYVLPVAAIAVTAFARPEVSDKVEKISSVKVNDLAAIVETKVAESAGDTTKPADVKYVPAEVRKRLKGTLVFEVAEEMPEFPGGGMSAFMDYIKTNMRYPASAKENGTQGRVTVQFVVDEDGSIKDSKVLRSVDKDMDAEALRLINTMPKWKPGRQKGQPVAVKFTVPVMFRLDDDKLEKTSSANGITVEGYAGNGKEPLYIVDGKEVTPSVMSALNPDKDLEGFKALVEKYYGTEFLPVLPVHFQEAVIVMSEKEPDYWKRFNVSETIVARFTDYKKQVLANRNNSAIAGLLNRSYGNTYWFYFMFK